MPCSSSNSAISSGSAGPSRRARKRSATPTCSSASSASGRIDLYKSGCFVLEAKPSRKREKGGEVYEQVAFALETGDREEDERISAPAAFALGALAGDSTTPLARSGPYPSPSPMLEPLC